MTSGEPSHLPHGEMLYASTGRMLLGQLAVALISSAGVIVLIALVLGGLQNGWEEPSWEWEPALAAADVLGATLLRDSWSMLGVFATVLVAVALAGRGTFTQVEFQDAAVRTHTGLLKGGTDRRLSLRIVGRIGTFCGLYLAFACVLITFHVVHEASTKSAIGGGRAVIVIPVMAGGLILAARIGAFVSDVDTQLSQLRRARSELTTRCDQLRRRIAPLEEVSSRWETIRILSGETLAVLLIPALILGESAVLLSATSEVLGMYLLFLLFTTGIAMMTVVTPWMTDVFKEWVDKAFVIWWWCVFAIVHLLWLALSLQLVLFSGRWVSASIVLAAVVYAVQILWHARRYVIARRAQRTTAGGEPDACITPHAKAVSPFFTIDRVVLGDRVRQLHSVEQQIRDLEGDRRVPESSGLERRARKRSVVPRQMLDSKGRHS